MATILVTILATKTLAKIMAKVLAKIVVKIVAKILVALRQASLHVYATRLCQASSHTYATTAPSWPCSWRRFKHKLRRICPSSTMAQMHYEPPFVHLKPAMLLWRYRRT